jgi:hypothetical protein
LENIGTKQINIQVTQTLGPLTNSTAPGVVINNLDVSGVMSVQEAFNLFVLNPLQAIYSNGFSQPITILVDALDEALTHEGNRTIVDLLSKLATLPPQVRFILTSRKEVRIENKFADAEMLGPLRFSIPFPESVRHSSLHPDSLYSRGDTGSRCALS